MWPLLGFVLGFIAGWVGSRVQCWREVRRIIAESEIDPHDTRCAPHSAASKCDALGLLEPREHPVNAGEPTEAQLAEFERRLADCMGAEVANPTFKEDGDAV